MGVGLKRNTACALLWCCCVLAEGRVDAGTGGGAGGTVALYITHAHWQQRHTMTGTRSIPRLTRYGMHDGWSRPGEQATGCIDTAAFCRCACDGLRQVAGCRLRSWCECAGGGNVDRVWHAVCMSQCQWQRGGVDAGVPQHVNLRTLPVCTGMPCARLWLEFGRTG